MLAGAFNTTSPWFPWAVAIAASSVAAATDLHSRRIHNWLTGPVFLAGVIWAVVVRGPSGFGESLLASFVLATPFILLFVFAGGGAADAKLMGAVGAWLGLTNCPMVLVTVTASGALIGIGAAIFKRQMAGVMANSFLIVWGLLPLLSGQRSWRQAQDAMPQPVGTLTIPYGLAIFSGTCVAAAATYAWRGAGL